MIGWRHEIEKLTREDALEFYRRFYTPNNAILIVAGDVTADEVKTARRGDLRQGPARRRDQAARAPAGAGAGGAAHRHARRSARHAAERAALLPRAVLRDRPRPGEAEALDVLAHILGRGSNSRLYQKLVVDKRHRGERRRRLLRHRARQHAPQRLRHAEAGHHARRSSKTAIDAVIAEVVEKGVTARGARARQEPADRRRRLCAGQPAHAGALVRRRADDRHDGRAGRDLAGPRARRHRRRRCATPRANGSTSAAR